MTHATPTAVIAYVHAMPAIDLFDYLADYTADEPRDDASRMPAAMRAAVLAHILAAGPATFLARMAEQNGADDAPALPPTRAESRRIAKGF